MLVPRLVRQTQKKPGERYLMIPFSEALSLVSLANKNACLIHRFYIYIYVYDRGPQGYLKALSIILSLSADSSTSELGARNVAANLTGKTRSRSSDRLQYTADISSLWIQAVFQVFQGIGQKYILWEKIQGEILSKICSSHWKGRKKHAAFLLLHTTGKCSQILAL